MKNILIEEYNKSSQMLTQMVRNKQPIKREFLNRYITTLQQLDDEFVKESHEDISVYMRRIEVNAALKYWCEKLKLPVDKYIENIKSMRIKLGIEE